MKYDYKTLTPFKLQCLTSFPFIDEDFDALTNYELLCKIVEYLNNISSNNNMLVNNIDDLNNWFNNLDVQDEVNNKLDEMAQDGTLAEIIANYADIAEIKDVVDGSGLARLLATGKFLTNSNSWIGIINDKYTGDDATRVYLIPKDKVENGVGGCLKIFADNYFENQDYRDLGIYFSANQNGDTGYYGNGVNWINVKVLDNGMYAGKHPDLGFSFQDGNVVAGRITCYGNSRAMWVFGSNKSTLQGTDLIAEFQKSVGLTKTTRLKFEVDKDNNRFNDIFSDADGNLTYSLNNVEKKYISGTQIEENSLNTSNFKNAIITTNRVNVNSETNAISVLNSNRVVLGNTNNSTIRTINGSDGQEIVIVSVAPGNTIENNGTIHLQNNTNYTMTMNSTLTLININGTWYEKSRSVNS